MFRFKVEMFFIKGATWLLLKLPESKRYRIGDFLGYLSYKLIKKRRLVTHRNISYAFPNKSEQEIEAIALKSYQTMVKTFMMSLWIPDTCRDDNKVKYSNYEIFEEAKSKGKGVVIASLHMGCFEAAQKIALTNNLYDVVKPQKNVLLDKFMNDNRKRTGLNIIYKDSAATRDLIKALKNKDIVCLFSDHYDLGCDVEFFGRKTQASNGVASLSLKYDAPVVLMYNILDDKGINTIYFDKIIEMEKSGSIKDDIVSNTQKIIHEFERLIRNNPEQWMWFHRRWRD